MPQQSWVQARATTFANLSDLRRLIEKVEQGLSIRQALAHGDNGKGSGGAITAQYHTPMVALPAKVMVAKWGSVKAAMGKMVEVKVQGLPTIKAEVQDTGPEGVIDLNPAFIHAAFLQPDTEFSKPAEWRWI